MTIYRTKKGIKNMRRSYRLDVNNVIKHKNNNINDLADYGPSPFVFNIDQLTKRNDNYRTALWTGNYLQLTLMSIEPGEDIGQEIHHDLDQFLRVEEGRGIVRMGYERDRLNYQEEVNDDFAIIVPAGTWHNVINTGSIPLKLYSIYAPPQHPRGTIQETREDAMADEERRCKQY